MSFSACKPGAHRWLVSIVVGVLCSCLLQSGAFAQVDAPALWKIPGPRGNIYLFGSFHLLPPDVKWRTAALDSALTESSVVVVEALMGRVAVEEVNAQVARTGFLPKGQTLRSVLPAELFKEFTDIADELEAPIAALEPMRPWLAGMTLSVQLAAKMGFDISNGVDLQVETWASDNGKRLAAFETAASQLDVFGSLSREQETQFLGGTLRQIRETPKMLESMLDAYRTGNVAALDRTVHFSLEGFPELRRRLLLARHERWLPQIEKMIASGQSHVIVVGAAHLIGRDSLIAMLRAKGVKVEGP